MHNLNKYFSILITLLFHSKIHIIYKKHSPLLRFLFKISGRKFKEDIFLAETLQYGKQYRKEAMNLSTKRIQKLKQRD